MPTLATLRGAAAHWAAATPDAVALTCGTEHVTWAELADRVHRLAAVLRDRGVGPERLVGVAGTRTTDLVVALLGVIEAGGAYVPLDPEHPAERLDGLVADAGLDLVVTTGAVPWTPTGAEVLRLDDPAVTAADPARVPDEEIGLTPEHAAYVIYTSGSTGKPKGCVVTHACVTALMDGTDGWFGFGPDDVWTLFHSYAFDFTVWELWGALRYGGRLVVVDEATRRSPDELWALLRREGVTVLNQTPTAFYQLMEADRVAGPAPDLALRVVVFGGEALDLGRLDAWYQRHADDAPALVNMFGITETTVHVTYVRLDRETAASAPGSVVGEAIPGLEVHVLDDALQPVAVGVTGEIYVSGAQLARGYLGRPALTASRFVASPFGPPGSRLYRSGDVGRWVAPGVLEHQGRADSQVKVRGYRIELGEVEAALRALDGVRDAVATTRPRPDGDGVRLVGYVVPAEDAVVDAGRLRAALAETLPSHMIPSALVPIVAVPLTVNGKLDTAALPDPGAARGSGGRARTDAEAAVVAVFSEVLGVAGIGPDDDFFALGGDSLLAVRAANLLRARRRVGLSGGTIHALRTAAAVAAALDDRAPVSRPGEVGVDGPPRLASGQRRMWAQSAFDGDSTAHHVPVVWRIAGPVDATVLGRALDDVVARHEVLRTLVAVGDDGPRPRVVRGASVPLATRWAPADRLLAEAEALTAGPFDLAVDLPIRAALVSAAHDEHVLRLEVHHLAIDEWSLPVLARDLAVAHAARAAGTAPAWEPLPVQVAGVARWEQARLAAAPDGVGWWVDHLVGAPAETALPFDRPAAGSPVRPAAEVAVTVDGAAAERVRALAAQGGTTPFVALTATIARVLRAEGAAPDLVLGTTVTDRGDPDLDDLVGYLSTTVALRIDLAGADDPATAVARARSALVAALDHSEVPFDRVVDAVGAERTPGRHPIFQVMVVGDDHAAQHAAPHLGAARAERVRIPDRHARFDLEWHVEEQPHGSFSLRLVHATDRFTPATAQRLAHAVLADLTTPPPSATRGRMRPERVTSSPEFVICEELGAVVGVPGVGAEDDFFAVGGDSIMAIQLANRLRRRGITLSPWEVFRLRTAAAMAEAASASASVEEPAAAVAEGDVGPLAMTPIAHRLRGWGGPVERFNQSALVVTPAGLTADDMRARLAALVAAHGALRQQLHRPDPRLWSLEVRAEGAIGLTVVDASATEAGSAERRRLVAEESDRAADRLDPGAGVMADAVWFDAGPDRPGRLLLVVHHLAVDGVSWSVLLDDLRTGTPAPTGAPLRAHAAALAARAQGPGRAAELGHWLDVLAPGADLVGEPVGAGTVADTAVVTVTIPPAEATALLTVVPGSARTEVTEVLLAGLGLAVGRRRGAGDLLVDLERHGRDVHDDLDVSRTVGWFTALAPVRLGPAATPVEALHRARVATAAAPDRGAGFGELRYLDPAAGPILAAASTPQVLLNYLGRYGAEAPAEATRPATGEDGAGEWGVAPEADALRTGPHPDMGAGHVLALDVFRRETPDGPALEARVTYRADVLAAAEATALAEGWRTALADIAAAVADEPLPLGPADLDLVALTDAELEAVDAAVTGRVEDVWPLSPLQEGLLFEAQLRGEAYTAQYALDLDRRLDPARVERALRALLHRHPTLRAGFTTAGLAAPVQAIVADPEVVVPEIDLTGPDDDERAMRLADVMETDRIAPFALARPPLCRVTVVHLDDDRDRLIVNRQVLLWDGWSVHQVTRELLALYEADGDPAGLEPLTGTFPDYLRWLAAQDPDVALDRWRDALDGSEGIVFPHALGAVDLSRPEVLHRTLPDELTAALRATAADLGVTLNSVLNAALALVLGFVSGADDVTFGSTVSGRPTDVEGLDRVVGLFLNTVPVRTALAPEATLAELVQQVHDRRVDLMAHDFVGLAAIQRTAGQGQLFDVLYVLQNFEDFEGTADLYRRHGVVAEESEDHTQYPLTVVVAPDRQIRLRVEHRPDLIGAGTAEALTGRLVQALEAIADQPRQRASAVDLLLPGEAAGLKALTTSVPGPADLRTVADHLAVTAAEHPDVVGLVCGDERLTFARLDARTDRLARLYRAHGAGPETVVALGLGRCVDMVVSMLAVLRTGAAYLPLELDHPPARLAEMVADAGAVLTVARTATAHAVPEGALLLDDPAVVAELEALPAEPLTDDELGPFARTEPTRLERPAYVVYTSGSTGRPKGVVTPHRGLTNMLVNHHERIFAPALDEAGGRRFRVAHTVSFAFDMSWEEILWLIAGHEVHVCDEDLRRDAAALVAYCDEHRIDVVNVTPTYARVLLDEGLLATDDGGHRPPLVMLGGEAISESVWATLRDTPGTSGYNLYGPTEYTINALGGGTADSATPTIGRPIMGTDAVVLDGWLRPVPVGVPGELYLCGVGTARGYHDRPGLTASAFVASPDRPGERMYRTGDLVRVRPDGNVDYLGRTDDQVKVRGHRVEPAEVASVLDGHERVRASAVVAAPDPAGGQRLVAYVVPAADVSDDEDGADEDGRADERAHVEEWQGVYEGEYTDRTTALLGEDYSGWTSSEDGTPIPFAEMQRWRRDAVSRIRSVLPDRPARVAELGVGGGLILSGLATDPAVEEYWGTDLSPTVIAALERDLAAVDLPARVVVRAQPADDVTGLPTGHFDAVVVNSVIQYLPGLDHLRSVIEGALTLLAPGGSVFVGDVRHHGLLEHFHGGDRRAIELEKELLVDPDWFAGLVGTLPGVTGVDIRLKDADDDNELSRYRYDVVVRTGPDGVEAPVDGLAWGVDVGSAEELKRALATDARDALRLAGVPNPRLERDPLAPLTEAARSAGYAVVWTWNGSDPTLVDAVLRRSSDAPLVGTYRPGGTRPAGNDPLGSRRAAALVGTLRDHLRTRLPDHMVPSALVVVDHLPLTTNGKLDVAALPEPATAPTATGRPPATPLEAQVCAVVADVLGLAEVGADDNFFLLGGHSLLAMRLVARLTAEVGGDLRVSDVLAGQTPEDCASALQAAPEARGADTDPALAPVLRIGARSGPALFCIHPLFGLSWVYAGLARHLDGHTIYGLQSALHSGGPAADSLDELARRYAAEVRRLEPEGPYHLLGWSFGGPVAHRMACALQEDGAEVGSLVIIDAVPSEAETWRAAGDERDREYAEWYLGPLPEAAALAGSGDVDEDGVVRLADELAWLEDAGRATDAAMVDKLVAVARRHSAHLEEAGPTPVFRGDVIFVGSTPDEEEPYTADPTTWDGYVDGTLAEHHVGFPHHRLMSHQAIEELGPLVRRLLASPRPAS